MAKKRTPQAALLEEYKRVALAQKMHLEVVLARRTLLQNKRRGLASSKNLTDAKRAEWNQLAKEWRAEKERVLAEAQRIHRPKYDFMVTMANALSQEDRALFQRVFHTVNGFYVKADSKLRMSTLEDL